MPPASGGILHKIPFVGHTAVEGGMFHGKRRISAGYFRASTGAEAI